MKMSLLSILTVLAVLAFIPCGYAGNVYVDINYAGSDSDGTLAKPFKVIQTAINRAIPGDIINVAAGTYYEWITLRDEIDLIGAGFSTTVIDAGYSAWDAIEGYELTDCLVRGFTIRNGNVNGYSGGGIYLENSVITFDKCAVTNCKTTYYESTGGGWGGGLFATRVNDGVGSNVTLTSCTFASNAATMYGAGVAIHSSSLTATDCIFDANQATDVGGGIFLSNSTATIDKCLISNNSALHGGGIYWKLSSGAVRRSTITANLIARDGAGIFIEGGLSSASVKLTRNYIGDNMTYGGKGGGVYFWGSSAAAIYNCIVAWNTSNGFGGGIVTETCSPKIINNTIVSNKGKSLRGGIYTIGTSIPTILNCILWDNSDDLFSESGNISANYTQVQNGDAGTENSAVQPGFANILSRDYTLVPTSPCINTGSPTSLYNDRNGTRNDRGYTGGPYYPLAADVDDSACVNILDLIVVRSNLGLDPASGGKPACDVNKDGKINILDLIAVRSKLGIGCGIPMWP